MKTSIAIIGVVCAVVAAMVLLRYTSSPLTVWVFDVGQGDAIFIDGPEKQVLIDGGPGDAVLEKLGAVLLPWDRTLDVVILTHPHADHVFGLNTVLERYAVGEVFSTLAPYDEPPAVAFAQQSATPIVQGDVIDLGDGAQLAVLWPAISLAGRVSEDPNDGSVVLRLTYGETTMLLTGDAGVAEEERFAAAAGNVDVLKVGHHGSDTSTGAWLLNIVDPEYAVVSVGEGNSYGHPSPIVLERLANVGATVLRTDVDGDVQISSDGGEPKVRVFGL